MARLKEGEGKTPPGPFRPEFWKSPLRGRRLTAILGLVLLVGMGIVLITGFLSHIAYNPDLRGNAIVDPARDLPINFDWPTSPSWLFALTQGLHVTIGLVMVPILLTKLWSVMPRLFAWPPASTPAQAIERGSVALLVSSTIFLIATGLFNAQYWYPFNFGFVAAHYWAAVIFLGSFLLHVAIKLPLVVRHYRGRDHDEPDLLKAARPAPATISRRGLLAFTGAGAGLVLVGNAGQAIGGPFRKIAFLAPRRESGFPVNKTAMAAGIKPEMTGSTYRLELGNVSLSREQLLAMPQHTESLPIACVEGWSATRSWTGVRLSDLAKMAGVPDAGEVYVQSLQESGGFRKASLSRDQINDSRSMLALKVEGEDLSMDHGFPARVIVPALPGVHNTKWVASMEFTA